MTDEIKAAVALLTENGWKVLPPADAKAPIPMPKRGEVWVSPQPKVLARTVKTCGPRWQGSAWIEVRYHVVRSNGQIEERVTSAYSWEEWARKTGARPMSAGEAP